VKPQSTAISAWVEKNVSDAEARYLFTERSGLCLADGATVEEADAESFRQVFGKDWRLNYE
jgi:hypothetical protein